MKKFLAILALVFMGFVMVINYNNQFYIAAQEHPNLVKITAALRFRKLDNNTQQNDADYLEPIPFRSEVVESEKYQITQPVLDDHFLVFHKMIDDTAYFIEKSIGAAMIDPNHKIWRLNNHHFEEVIDIERLDIYDSTLYLNDYAIVGNDTYLSYSDQNKEYFYIYMANKQGLQLLHKGIFRNIYYNSNVPLLIQKDNRVYFTSFDKNLDRYILTLNCIEAGVLESKIIRTYENSRDPHDVPIHRLIALDDDYLVLSETQANIFDWENNVDKLQTEYRTVILDRHFTHVETVEDKYHALILEEGIVSFSDDSYHYHEKETAQSKYFNSLSDLYDHLSNKGIAVYEISNGESLFDEFSILAPSITYLPENYPDTEQKVQHDHLFFTENDSVLIVDREYGKREVALIKLYLE